MLPRPFCIRPPPRLCSGILSPLDRGAASQTISIRLTFFLRLSDCAVRSLATPLVDAYRLMINKQNALALFRLIIALVASLAAERSLVAQIYITNGTNGTIGEYSLSGAVINSALVSGLHNPSGLIAYDGNLYVNNAATGTVGVYNATTGTAVNPSLITGLAPGNVPSGIAEANGELYVLNGTHVSVFGILTGASLVPSLTSGFGQPAGPERRSFVPRSRQSFDCTPSVAGTTGLLCGDGRLLPSSKAFV